MYLLIQAITKEAKLILFNKSKKILDDFSWNINRNESDTLLPNILDFLDKNNLNIKELSWIVVSNWPWWFTWTRIISLVVSTIAYTNNTNLYKVDAFELAELAGLTCPIIIEINREECIVKNSKNLTPEIINTNTLDLDKKYSWFSEYSSNYNLNLEYLNKENYIKIIKNLDLKDSLDRIEPWYCKKPNITSSKKNNKK